jgi:hypothetical protein
VVLSILQDPSTLKIASFCISVFSSVPSYNSHDVCGGREELVSSLAFVIQAILDLRSAKPGEHAFRTQFYVFSSSEQVALQGHLLDTALAEYITDKDAEAAIRLCIGALYEGANILSTSIQPLLLSGALLDFIGKGRSKAELKMCLERLGLPTDGSVEQLRIRLQDKIEEFKAEGSRSATSVADGEDRRTELGQLPRVVVVKKQVESLLALPVPGYWDLPECASILLSKDSGNDISDDDIFRIYKSGSPMELKASFVKRNHCIFGIIQKLRERVSGHSNGQPGLLVNQARALSVKFMDICKEDRLRKLFFMQQVFLLCFSHFRRMLQLSLLFSSKP